MYRTNTCGELRLTDIKSSNTGRVGVKDSQDGRYDFYRS